MILTYVCIYSYLITETYIEFQLQVFSNNDPLMIYSPHLVTNYCETDLTNNFKTNN